MPELTDEELEALRTRATAGEELERQLAEERAARAGDTVRLAKLEALREFPNANPELLEMFQSTNLEDIKGFAQKLHESHQAPAPPPGGEPPPVPAPGDVPDPGSIQAQRRADLLSRVNTLDKGEREELEESLMREGWNRHVGATRELSRSA